MSGVDEAFLELDEAPPAPPPAVDPTPDMAPARDDESFLEVLEVDAATAARRARVVTDDDLRVVTALADDAQPLLLALWPARPDLAADPPTADALGARVDLARAALNQVTRRGAEWRARAEVASAVLSRRVEALRARHRDDRAAWRDTLLRELSTWNDAALDADIDREAGARRALYADAIARLTAECTRRGLDASHLAARCAARGVELLRGEAAAWSACDALPGAPRTLDDAADAIDRAPAQALAALREGALTAWLRGNRAPDALVAVVREAQSLAERAAAEGRGDAQVALCAVSWALGREGVAVDGVRVVTPDALLGHLRTARLDDARVAAAGEALGQWFRRQGSVYVAAACEALARAEPHAAQRLRWALGEPLRLGARAVNDPTQLAREALTRAASREALATLWRSGALRAWLDALPRAKRDALWHDELARDDEASLWRGVYRRAPRAPLRIHLDGPSHRVVRFDALADLMSTARVAAVWSELRAALARGELHAWLSHAAPGIELEADDAPPDLALNRLLWSLGHTGLVVPWGRGGAAVAALGDVVGAWRRGPTQWEAALATGLPGEWLGRFHAGAGVAGVTFARALARWGATLGAGALPQGVAGLRVALLAGLDELPADPAHARGTAAGCYTGLDTARRDRVAWEALWRESATHLHHGTALLWAARHAPALGVMAAAQLDDAPPSRDEVEQCLVDAGVPVASASLAEELASAREAAEHRAARRSLEAEAARLARAREEARVALEHRESASVEAAEAQRRDDARAAVRREVDREIARLTSERDAARVLLEREVARVEAERALLRVERDREVARLQAERDEARRALASDVARVDALEQGLRDAARRAAEEEAGRVLVATEPERREAIQRAAERAAERAAREAAARVAEARRQEAAETARREQARAEAEETIARLLAQEESARAEAHRRAEDAMRVALSLAEDEVARRESERLAEEAARAEAQRREAEREAEWAAARRRAQEELDALTAAAAKARDAYEALLREHEAAEAEAEAVARTSEPPVDEAEVLAALAGSLEEEGEEVLLDEEALAASAARHEVAFDRLGSAYTVTDDGELASLRAAMDAWARVRPRHPLADMAARAELVSITLTPTFEVHVATRLESRMVTAQRAPWPDDDAVTVPPDARDAEGKVDPWLLELPDADTWDAFTLTQPLDTPPRDEPCGACASHTSKLPAGHVPCARCEGEGTVACPGCGAWGRVRCVRCAGAGELADARGATARCGACQGRGDVPCGRCTMGRVTCPRCDGARHGPCERCEGRGAVRVRDVVTQTYLGVSALSVVADGAPVEVAREVRARGAEPSPVVHVEGDAIDPAALAREVPHAALGAAMAELLAAEVARAVDGQRATRQRVVARRYPVYEVRYRVDGRDDVAWVHGAQRAVHAGDSPLSRHTRGLLDAARDAVAREDVTAAVAALTSLADYEPDHAEAREAAGQLGACVLAMATRGELYAARDAVEVARAVRWRECVARLVETERLLARRLQTRSGWALAEEARGALDRGQLERCADRLTALAAVDASSDEGRDIAAALGARLADEASARVTTGDLETARRIVARARAVPFAACGDAVGVAASALATAEADARRATWRPRVVALLVLLAALAALWWRARRGG